MQSLSNKEENKNYTSVCLMLHEEILEVYKRDGQSDYLLRINGGDRNSVSKIDISQCQVYSVDF